MTSVHKYGFGHDRDFVIGLLECGWEPNHTFLEALSEQLPDLDVDDVEDWIEEWKRELN